MCGGVLLGGSHFLVICLLKKNSFRCDEWRGRTEAPAFRDGRMQAEHHRCAGLTFALDLYGTLHPPPFVLLIWLIAPTDNEGGGATCYTCVMNQSGLTA